MAQLCGQYSFHLLDKSPVVIGDVGFVGNCGWYDGSLFETGHYRPALSRSRAEEASAERFRNLNPRCTEQEFFDHCIERAHSHIDQLHGKRIVLGIHHVPSPDFVFYGKSAEFDKRNYWMGSTRLAQLYQHPAVVLGLTGHTHRSDNHMVGAKRVYNISSTSTHPSQEFVV